MYLKENFQNLPPIAAIFETADRHVPKKHVPTVQKTVC